MKKGVVISSVFLSVFVLLFLVGIASAYSPVGNEAIPSSSGVTQSFDDIAIKVSDVISGIGKIITPVLSVAIGEVPENNSGDLLMNLFFMKLLFFIIFLSVVWVALSKVNFFSEYPFVLWTISIAVSILGTRFFTDQGWLQMILLPYETVFVAISAGIPFIIYGIVVEVGLKGPEFKTLRRIAWIFFMVIFIGLWFTRYDLGDAVWVYPITALLCFGMIIFDGTFQRVLHSMKMDRAKANSTQEMEEYVLSRYIKIDELVTKGAIDAAEGRRRKQELQKRFLKYTR